MRRDDIIGRTPAERLAVALFAAAFLALLAAMPGWRADDRPDPGSYAMAPAAFAAWEEAFAARYATDAEGRPVVRPPPGDVPVLARRFAFVPELELQAGHTYRLHLSAGDTVHSAVLDGREVLLVPGRVAMVTITPLAPGPLELRCGEYCGLGHSRMRGGIVVVP
jgi:cytochrome c oxidase subunit 2